MAVKVRLSAFFCLFLLFSVAGVVSAAESGGGPVVWYGFDQSSGPVVRDLSGHGNDAKVNGGASFVPGKNGSAIQFNGVNSYLDCGNNESLRLAADFTVSFWVKVDVPQPSPYATIASWAKGADGWAIHYGMPAFPGEYAHFMVQSTFPGLGGSMGPVLDDGRWHYVCFTYHANQNAGSYVDGISRYGRKMPAAIRTHDGNLLLGEHGADSTGKYYFKGAIDDFRLYGRVLSPEEVKDLYQAGNAGIASPEDQALRDSIKLSPASFDYSLLKAGANRLLLRGDIPAEVLARCGSFTLSLRRDDRDVYSQTVRPVPAGPAAVNFQVPALEPGLYKLVGRLHLKDGRVIKECEQSVAVCSRLLPFNRAASAGQGDAVILDDFSLFSPAIASAPADGSWYTRGYSLPGGGASKRYLAADGAAPVIRCGLPLKGWYAVYLGLVNPGKGVNVSLATGSGDFSAVSPVFHTRPGETVIEERFLRCVQFTGDQAVSLKPSFILRPSALAYIKLVRLTDRQIALAAGKKDISNGKEYIRYNDGDGIYWGGRRGVDSIRYTASIIKKQGDFFDTLDFGVGGGDLNYPTRVGTMVGGDLVIGPSPTGHQWVAQNLRDLAAAGVDPLTIIVEESHQDGIRLIANLRMDTYYEPGEASELFNSRFWKSHPEFRLTFWPSRGPETSLDYFYPQVRDERLGILREVASGYDVDGVDLDFTRYVPFFGIAAAQGFKEKFGREPDLQGNDQEWYRYRAGIMTQLVRDVRRMLDQEGGKKNKRIQLWALVPWSHTLANGLDCETWMKEGLVDVISAGTERQTNAASDVDVTDLVRMAKGTSCKVYARLDLNYGDDPAREQTPTDWAGFASPPDDATRNIFLGVFRQGAAGVFLFNDFLKPRPELFQNLERWSEFEDTARSPITEVETAK